MNNQVRKQSEIISEFREQARLQPLSNRSKEIRMQTIKLAKPNGGYHFGGSFSAVEILLSVFDDEREGDRFIMSKGHG